MKRKTHLYSHSFYCMNCGREGLPIARNRGHLHAKNHRKALWCPWCQQEVNHVECKTYDDVIEFKENFENGVYKDEAADSISYLRARGFGQDNLGKI